MSLRLITGPARSDVDELIIERLQEAALRGTTTLVVPTTSDVRLWSDGLVQRRVLGVEATTFDSWIRRTWMSQGDGRTIVGAAARTALMRVTLENFPTQELERIGTSPGLVLLLADVAKRLPHDPCSEVREPEVREVAEVLRRYRRLLDSCGYIEAAEATRLLSEDPKWHDGHLFLTQFSDFEQVEEGLLIRLAESGEVTIALVWEPGRAAYAGAEGLIRRLSETAADTVRAQASSDVNTGLSRFFESVFETRGLIPQSGDVSFCEASCADAEIALIARIVRERIDAGGAETSVAVVFREVADRAAAIAAALESLGIEHSVDVRIPFSSTGFGRALLCGIDACAGRGAGTERLVAFLSSPFSGCDRDWVADSERAWRRTATSAHDALEDATKRAPVRASRTLRLLSELAREGVRTENVNKWQMLAGLMLANRSRGKHEPPAPADASAHKALLAAVGELAQIGLDWTESHLISALRSVEVSTGGPDSRGVLVTEAHRLRGRCFDVVVVGGLTSSEFSPEPRESLACTLLERLGVPKRVDERLQERTLFHTVITRANGALVLTRTAVDEKGEPLRASAFWDAALDVYRSPADVANGIEPEEVTIRKEDSSGLATLAPARLHGTAVARLKATSNTPRPPSRGLLADERVLRSLENREEFSVSEVETYLSCPYRWFVERIVRPRRMDSEFDARERGSLAHRMLATFYSRWQEMGFERVTPAQLSEALELFEEVAGESTAGHPALKAGDLGSRVAANEAVRWARTAIIDDSRLLPGFVPESHEYAFGQKEGVSVELGGVSLVGRIDRVDSGPGGAIVTDYKTSSDVSGRGSFETKGLLQAPLYAAVLKKLTGETVVGALYRSLSTREIRGVWVRGAVELGEMGCDRDGVRAEEFVEEIECAVERLRVTIDRMRSGVIAPSPGSGSCRRCSVVSWCSERRS